MNSNYLNTEFTEKYDLILLIYCDFCALSPEERKILLKKIFYTLKEDGYFLFDVHSENHFFDQKESLSFYHNNQKGFRSAEEHFVN